jgi:hypothetical protein
MKEQKIHQHTAEEKEKWWGEGEWVNEPDLVSFEHMGIQCKVLRMAIRELYAKDFHVFGGYLNGYVAIPSDHPYYQKKYEDMNIECHQGLTFGEYSDTHWIGFDCAHSGDYIPSTEHIKKTDPGMQEWRDRDEVLKKRFNLHDSPIFKQIYRNIQFCIDQCKHIAEQLILIALEGKEK